MSLATPPPPPLPTKSLELLPHPPPSSPSVLSVMVPAPPSSSEVPFVHTSADEILEKNTTDKTMSIDNPLPPPPSQPPSYSDLPPNLNTCADEITEENTSINPPPPPSSASPSSSKLPPLDTCANEITGGNTSRNFSSLHHSIRKIKKLSLWRLLDLFTSKRKRNDPVALSKSISDDPVALSRSISNDIVGIKKALEEALRKFEKYKYDATDKVESASKKLDQNVEELRKLQAVVTKLKLEIPSKINIDAGGRDPHQNLQSSAAPNSKGDIPQKLLEKMPQLHKANTFENSLEFQDFLAHYRELSIEQKLCLLCFSVFPEDAIIKKRLMVYWWIGEGFVQRSDKKTAEEYGNEFFNKLMELGFIEPFNENLSPTVGSCRMHPFIRSAVVTLANKANFFDFDSAGNPTNKFSCSYRACLLGERELDIKDVDKLHALFNVKETSLEFKTYFLLRMKNVNVLYLGSWQAPDTRLVVVEDSMFLEGLKNMKHLRFFSLQGISGIKELPESISQLKHLMILDLRACLDLERIPKGIGLLENLTHLDVSECYLLDHLPKTLTGLTKLQVLKGFIVGDTSTNNSCCTLDGLKKLSNLRKLGIFTRMKNFPEDEHMTALGTFTQLLKLTIAWGSDAIQGKPDEESHRKVTTGRTLPPSLEKQDPESHRKVTTGCTLPPLLEKLDLTWFPTQVTPKWLMPSNLKGLKKLYIRRGKFFDLGQFQDVYDWRDRWGVEQLRLKYLGELEMDWRELQELFPNLIYLEKVECPKLSFFPCDERGVWINNKR